MRLRVLWFVVPLVVVAVVVAVVALTSGGGGEEPRVAAVEEAEAEVAAEEEAAEVVPEAVEEAVAETVEEEPPEVEEEPAEVAEDVESEVTPEPVEEEPSPCENGRAVPNPARNPGLVRDCEALLALKQAADDGDTLTWSPSRAVWKWSGVSVGGEPSRVTRLDLDALRLTGHIPAELGRLTALDILSLENNELSGAIPAALGALEKLRYLLLENNQLSGSIPGDLGALRGLWRLKLGGNQLTGPIPPELASMVSLGTLELHDNQLSGTVPRELENLPDLHRLTLAGNAGLTGCLPPSLRAPSGIIRPGDPPLHIDLPDCPPRVPPAELCRNGTIVTKPEDQSDLVRDCTILLAAKDALTGDATLNWDGDTPIAAWDGIRVGGAPLRVHAIDLASRGLTGHIPPRLGFLPALVALRLNDNDLTGAIPGALTFLPSLESLTVQGNPGLTGCIPLALRDVRDNDLAGLGLSECAPSPCENGTVVANPAEQPGLVHDCTALLLGQAVLAGDARLNWDADTPITEWEGVTVDGSPLRVHGLALDSHGLRGPVPPELGALSELRNLSLASGPFERGQLTGPIPATLGSLLKLEVLDLRRNGLAGAIPTALGTLENLQNLSLAGNRLSGPVPAALAGLGNLRRLSLGGNRLSGTIPEALGELSNLMFLDLGGNLLTGTIPAALGELRQLQHLSLGGNLLTGAIPKEFGALENLVSLSLASNRLTGSVPGELKSLRRLDFLSLGGNFTVTGCIPPVLRHLYPPANDAIHIYLPTCTPAHICEDGLVVANPGDNPGLVGDCAALLMVETELAGNASPYPWDATLNWDAGTPITEWEGVTVGGTPARVRELDLESRGFTGRIEPRLARLSGLRELRLVGNELKGMIPAALGELPALERLSLSGNADFKGCIPPALREGAGPRPRRCRPAGLSAAGPTVGTVHERHGGASPGRQSRARGGLRRAADGRDHAGG